MYLIVFHILLLFLFLAPVICVFVCIKETLFKKILYSLNLLLLNFAIPLIVCVLVYKLTAEEDGSGGYYLDIKIAIFIYTIIVCGSMIYTKIKENKGK